MRLRAPLPLVLVAATYLAYEVWTLISQPSATVAVRLVLSLLLFYYVLRGSKAAGYVLVACCVGATLICAYAVANFPSSIGIWFAVGALPCVALACYVLFSPAVRRFQAEPVVADTGPI